LTLDLIFAYGKALKATYPDIFTQGCHAVRQQGLDGDIRILDKGLVE
jgi:hypothetical protein